MNMLKATSNQKRFRIIHLYFKSVLVFPGNMLLRRLRLYGPKPISDPCVKCPSCDSCFRFGQKSFFCPQCNTVHGTNKDGITDYFSLLGIQQSFTVNLKEAELRYRALQKVVHPDHADPSSESNSNDYCALLNEAIATIKSPLSRAEHLLKLNNTSTAETSRMNDKALLEEIMDINDEVDEAIGNRDKLEECLTSIKIKLVDCESMISSAYESSDFSLMLTQVERMRFLSRVEARIQDNLRY